MTDEGLPTGGLAQRLAIHGAAMKADYEAAGRDRSNLRHLWRMAARLRRGGSVPRGYGQQFLYPFRRANELNAIS